MSRSGVVAVLAALATLAAVTPAVGQGAREPETITPLLMAVEEAPVPFRGSDGRTHLVYELRLTNFSSGDAVLRRVRVLDPRGRALLTLGPRGVAGRLQPAGLRTATGTMASSTEALLFLHVTLPRGRAVPRTLTHRITGRFPAAPPGRRTITETGGVTTVDRQPVAVVGPPLRGAGYLSADSCCDATRHTRAALPVNGRITLAQRFAVDWEQLDAQGRIYAGPRSDPESYAIYGDDVLAVADTRVVSTITGLPDATPGAFPAGISIQQADGNSIVVALGKGRYGLYAHLKPGSILVRPGDRVRRGQVIASVGNSGNSLAPHLHFHVMDDPSPLAANGLPYGIDAFTVTGRSPGTAAFDAAEADGTPLAIRPFAPPVAARGALPLDQLLVDFAP